MKAFFSIFIITLTAYMAHAQEVIKAGTVQLGGSINYNQQHLSTPNAVNTAPDMTTRTFFFSPAAGYFILDNLAVGVSLSYSKSTNTYSGPASTIDYRRQQFSIGPYVQYYQMLTQHFGLVGTLAAGYSRDTENDSFASSNAPNGATFYKRNGFLTSLTPGIVFFPITRFALSSSFGGLSYSYATNDGGSTIDSQNTYTTFGANFGLSQLTLSGTYFFGR